MADKYDFPEATERLAPRRADHRPTTPAEDDPDAVDVDPSQCFACVRGLRDRANVVELQFLDPNKPDRGLEYSLIKETQWDKAGGAIVIEFVYGLRAVIRGVGLHLLKEKLLLKRVRWVQERGNDPVAMKNGELHAKEHRIPFAWITEIEVTEPE